jgi:hypothetical protein
MKGKNEDKFDHSIPKPIPSQNRIFLGRSTPLMPLLSCRKRRNKFIQNLRADSMRKLVLIAGVGSFVIGMAILLYDFHFSHCYGEDVNDVAVVQQGKTFDWPTGERPLYTVFPAWFYL